METGFITVPKSFSFENCLINYYKTESFKENFQMETLHCINGIVLSGFGKGGDLEDVKKHIFESDNIGLIYVDSKIVGFATTRNYSDIDLCYLHGISISTTRKGLGTLLVREMFLNSEMSLCGFTTQNPAMYLTAKKCTSYLFPNPSCKSNDDFVLIGKKITNDRSGNFIDNMSIKNLYSHCLYEKIPEPNDPFLWKWWNQMIEINSSGESNDGIVFVGKINR